MVASIAYQAGRRRAVASRATEEAQELLARARSSLALARSTGRGILVEDLLVLTHQAVERAVRSVLVAEGVPSPPGATIAEMLATLEAAGVPVPARLMRAGNLFPGQGPDETLRIEKYYESVLVATEAIRFAEERVRG